MRKRFWIVDFCLLVLLAVTVSSIMTDSFATGPSDALRMLLGGGGSTHAFAVFQVRPSRIVLAIPVGSALGVSGAILQGITKSLLAKPGMIGISANSALFVVLRISYGMDAYYSFLSNVKVLLMLLSAITGAFRTTASLYTYSWHKRIRPIRFLLAGAGVNAGITVVISFYQLQVSKGDYNQALMWTSGFLWGSSWCYIPVSAPLTPFLAGLVWIHSGTLGILSLGDGGVAALGVSTCRTRILSLAVDAVPAALVTAVVGSIVSLGLLGPQTVLYITGMRHRLLLPLAALISSMLLVAADMLARNPLSPLETTAGILVSMIGVSYFTYLMMKLDRRQYSVRSTQSAYRT